MCKLYKLLVAFINKYKSKRTYDECLQCGIYVSSKHTIKNTPVFCSLGCIMAHDASNPI